MRHRMMTWLMTLMLLSTHGMAQEQFTEPPARLITRVPFRQLNGGIVILKAKVNSVPDSLNFIMDTGSGGISLDSTTCVEYGLVPEPSNRTIRGIGGIKKVGFINNGTLHLPKLDVDSLNFHVNDYEVLSSVYGIKIDGIVGYSFFSRYIVRMDYDSNYMEVFTPGEYRYPRGGHILRPSLVTIPIQQLRLKDRGELTNRFYFDTGAGLNFLISEDYVRDSSVLSLRKRRKPVITQAEGLGGRMTMRLTTIRELRLGPYKFRNVPTFLFDDEYNVTSYPFLGGLVGNDLIRRFNVTLNYRKREIHLIPNSHYNDLFDYAYTGIGMYLENGNVTIEDVAEGSPAEAAGLKKGDVILGINKSINANIQTYKTMMQAAGEKLHFIIQRPSGPIEIDLKPISIL